MRVQPCSITILVIFFEHYILIHKEISEPFPKHLFHYCSILIFSPALCNTDIEFWQEKGDETHRGNPIFMLVILKKQSVL